jgi:hypothetical protein
MNESDLIKITILSDGTIKVSTDEISPDNHASAAAFLREMSRLAGGETTIEAKHNHTHEQAHVHTDQHVNQ